MAIVPSRRGEERSLAERGGDPFSYLRNQVNRVFHDFWGDSWLEPRRESGAGRFQPQVDVTETEKEIKVCAEIPGVNPKDIGVSVEDGARSQSKAKRNTSANKTRKVSIEWSAAMAHFERTIALPAEVDEAKAKTESKKGVLKLTLPKRPGTASRRKKILIS
jgi:HSP20 family protein